MNGGVPIVSTAIAQAPREKIIVVYPAFKPLLAIKDEALERQIRAEILDKWAADVKEVAYLPEARLSQEHQKMLIYRIAKFLDSKKTKKP